MLIYIFVAFAALAGMTSCIEDGYVTSADAQPVFSVDTLRMGTFFTGDVTPTYKFMVYNRHDKIMTLSSITLREGGGEGIFRLNVDGISGKSFTNIDIRPNDSIFVFVEATIPVNDDVLPHGVEDKVDFITNGVTSTVVLSAVGQDVDRRRGLVIDRDTRLDAEMPYQIFDSLIVARDATLTLGPGVKLHFHDKARMRVDGTLVTLGTPEAPVELSGDRTDNVVGSIPFDLMASQWAGLVFSTTSHDNSMTHTVVRNTSYGVVLDSIPSRADGVPALYMLNCRLRNSAGYSLESHHSDITAIGCEIAEASAGVMYLRGGSHVFNHCTIANYYLFTALGGPAVQLSHFNADSDDRSGMPMMKATFANTIIYGNGTDMAADLTGSAVYLRRCLFKSRDEDDENFIDCLWDVDPLYYTVREDYIFDYRLRPESPAIGAGYAWLTDPRYVADWYGRPVSTSAPDLGAYTYDPSLGE